MRDWLLGLALATLIVPSLPILPSGTNTLLAQESLWKRYTSQRWGFSAVMPGTPQERKREGMTIFEVVRDEEAVRYFVGVIDLPAAFGNDKRQQKEFFEGVSESAEKGGGKLISYRSIAISGFPGREMNFTLPNNLVSKWRVYLVNKRAYLVTVTTTQQNLEQDLATSSDVFLSSFRVVRKK